MARLETRIADYLAHRMPEAGEVRVDDLARIHGGSSQETFRFRARWQQAGSSEDRRLILRRAPEAGLVNAPRDLEFTVYSALAGSGVPIPAAHFLELDPSWLDRPFFIMDMVAGKPGHFFFSNDPYEGQSETVGRNFWRHLGTLAAQDHRALGLGVLRGGDSDGEFWSRELDHWEAALDAGEAVIEPTVRGALRWLRRTPPPPAVKPAIVHGDYRCGNFLFLPDGSVSAVLDWEMCHVGDPLEDIAWAVNPMWTMEKYFFSRRGPGDLGGSQRARHRPRRARLVEALRAGQGLRHLDHRRSQLPGGQEPRDDHRADGGEGAVGPPQGDPRPYGPARSDGMRLTGETLLEGVAEALRDQIAPNLTDTFAGDAARMAQTLITIFSRASDDAPRSGSRRTPGYAHCSGTVANCSAMRN